MFSCCSLVSVSLSHALAPSMPMWCGGNSAYNSNSRTSPPPRRLFTAAITKQEAFYRQDQLGGGGADVVDDNEGGDEKEEGRGCDGCGAGVHESSGRKTRGLQQGFGDERD